MIIKRTLNISFKVPDDEPVNDEPKKDEDEKEVQEKAPDVDTLSNNDDNDNEKVEDVVEVSFDEGGDDFQGGIDGPSPSANNMGKEEEEKEEEGETDDEEWDEYDWDDNDEVTIFLPRKETSEEWEHESKTVCDFIEKMSLTSDMDKLLERVNSTPTTTSSSVTNGSTKEIDTDDESGDAVIPREATYQELTQESQGVQEFLKVVKSSRSTKTMTRCAVGSCTFVSNTGDQYNTERHVRVTHHLAVRKGSIKFFKSEIAFARYYVAKTKHFVGKSGKHYQQFCQDLKNKKKKVVSSSASTSSSSTFPQQPPCKRRKTR